MDSDERIMVRRLINNIYIFVLENTSTKYDKRRTEPFFQAKNSSHALKQGCIWGQKLGSAIKSGGHYATPVCHSRYYTAIRMAKTG